MGEIVVEIVEGITTVLVGMQCYREKSGDPVVRYERAGSDNLGRENILNVLQQYEVIYKELLQNRVHDI